MKFLKLSSVILLAVFFMGIMIPQAEAKRCKHPSHRSSKSSFGLSFNFGGPSFGVAQTVTTAPAVVAAPAIVAAPVYQYPTYVANPYAYAYPGYVTAPAYAYYPSPVVVQRQTQAQSVYVQPGFSYSYFGY